MTIKPFENDLHAMIQVFQKSTARYVRVIVPEGVDLFAITVRLLALSDKASLQGNSLTLGKRKLTVIKEAQFHPLGLTQGDVYLFDMTLYEQAEELCRKITKFTQTTGAMCVFASHKNEQ